MYLVEQRVKTIPTKLHQDDVAVLVGLDDEALAQSTILIQTLNQLNQPKRDQA